jgi:HD-GYP domain-containing protein (c-di-GMP phosphodiesterase class II)
MLEVGEIVRAHHERWDGGGYPDGLAGEAIPLEARIITCCDSWSAMRTDRPYRTAMSVAAATEQMIVNSGSQFDPAVVEAMMPVVAAGEASAVAEAPEASFSVPAPVSAPVAA